MSIAKRRKGVDLFEHFRKVYYEAEDKNQYISESRQRARACVPTGGGGDSGGALAGATAHPRDAQAWRSCVRRCG